MNKKKLTPEEQWKRDIMVGMLQRGAADYEFKILEFGTVYNYICYIKTRLGMLEDGEFFDDHHKIIKQFGNYERYEDYLKDELDFYMEHKKELEKFERVI